MAVGPAEAEQAPPALLLGQPREWYASNLKEELASQEPLLDEIHNFKQSPSSNGQQTDTCKQLVKLFRSVFNAVPHADGIMAMLRDLSSGGNAPPSVPEAVEQAMTRMEDPAAVAWAPKFAAALIATTETEPRARTTVRAVCLDMWQSHTHQEAESGDLTASSVCHGSQERSILVTAPGEVNITRVNEAVHSAMANLPKKSYTPGFFVAQAIRAADGHSTQHIPYDQKASGGFRDVGKHTTAEPLPTCWPLVAQVFHCFMQEVSEVDSYAVVAVFHTITAHCYSVALGEAPSASVDSLNKAMLMLQHASQAASRLRGCAYDSLTAALARLLQDARASLDAVELRRHRHCCAAAELPPLSHKATLAQLQPFAVDIPTEPTPSSSTRSDLAKVAVANLAPTSHPPQGNDLAALWAWVQRVHSSPMPKQQAVQVLHEIEQWFFQRAATLEVPEAAPPLSKEALQQAHQLAELYWRELLRFEEQHCSRHSSDGHTDMLKVELRSRETAVVWVMLCLAHHAAAAEFPGLREYALPVHPDDLRHLMLREGLAQQAVQALAGYIAAANCAASHGVVFSTTRDSTESLAAAYVADSDALQTKFSEEQVLLDQRMDAHWQKIQGMQAIVRDLEQQLAAAEIVLEQKKQAEACALAALNSATQTATRTRDACARELSGHKAEQEHLIAHLSTEVIHLRYSFRSSDRDKARSKYKSQPQYLELQNRSNAAEADLRSLISDQTCHCPTTAPGRTYCAAKQEVRAAQGHVNDLKRRIKEARIPPTHVYQAVPDPRKHWATCHALLFFLYPQLTGCFPLLRQYCSAAQQCLVPVSPSGTPKSSGHPASSRRTDQWAIFYDRTQQSCAYVPQPQRRAMTEGSTQMLMFRQQRAPAQTEFGPDDVMQYTSREIGVWWPDGDMSLRLWQGGPVARYTTTQFTNPFAAQDSVAIASSFTEPGRYHAWLQVAAAKEQSRLCLGDGNHGPNCCALYCFCDATEEVEGARGNRVLAEQGDRPAGMSVEQWRTFASLRAYPLQQLRVLCVALREGSLQLDCPQVAAAVRMVLYHVGQLDRKDGHVQRGWVRDADVEGLCVEMLRIAGLMEPAPKLLLHGPLICEVAAWLAQCSRQGVHVARSCMAMAAAWARQMEAEMTTLSTTSDEAGDMSRLYTSLHAKCAIAHSCAILCFGYTSFANGAEDPHAAMDRLDAHLLLLHRAQSYLHAFDDSSDPLQGRLTVLSRQCAEVMTHQVHALEAAVQADSGLLSSAVRGVFADLPQHVVWQPSTEHLGCYLAHSQGQVYSINIVSGCVLCNGLAPGHLPDTIVQHAAYGRLFGSATFEVVQLKGKQQGMFRTRQQHGGHIYSFLLRGQDLVVTECPVDADTGEMLFDLELELLASGCGWAPELPVRLREMYSHWLSRKKQAIVLRGIQYNDRRTHFILAPGPPTARARLKTMTCYCVPSHLQEQSWHSMIESMRAFDILWELPGKDDAARSMLSRFESQAFIHVQTQARQAGKKRPHTASSTDTVILYSLPRYRLTFELRPGETQLRCSNYATYHLPSQTEGSAAELPLARFRQFLLLQSPEETMPLKMLIPDGDVTREARTAACSVSRPEQCDAALGHHALSFNRRTLGFDTTVVHSRLFLAAIYAATHCEVPLPHLGMTAGEHAVELLRRSWVNRPLAAGEAGALAAVARFSGHTPALQLLCQALTEDSQSFAFLHGQDQHRSSSADRSQRGTHTLYLQDAQRTAPLPFVQARRQLTREEDHAVLQRAPCMLRNGSVRVARTVQWPDLAAAGVELEAKLAADIQEETFHKQLLKLHQSYCSKVAPAATSNKGRAVVSIDTSHLRGDAFGREIAEDLEESIRVLKKSPPDMHVERGRLQSLAKHLRALQEGVAAAERRLAEFLLQALAFTPPGEAGTAVAMFQAAALMAVPAQADLLRITLFPEMLQALNPLLSDNACAELASLALEWQKLCVLHDKLTRCLCRCSGAAATHMDASTAALAAELGNCRTWDPLEQPAWLALEVLQGLEIRERQATVAQHMLEHPGGPGLAEVDRGAILQLNMGEGKTRVILPMLVLALCGRGELPRVNFLQELLPEAVDYLHSCLTGSMLQVKLLLMPFNRDVEADAASVSVMTAQLSFARHSRAFLCVSREQRLSLQLKAQETFGNDDDEQAFKQLQQLSKIPTFDILDECDELLASKFQLVYAWGSQEHLPALTERVHVLQAVLQALHDDSYVTSLLADGAVAQVQHHEGHYGGMPETRLLAGRALDSAWPSLARDICRALITQQDVAHRSLKWMTFLDHPGQNLLLQCCTDSLHDVQDSMQQLRLSDKAKSQVLMLRGLLAFGLLRHCLQKRHNVDYGVTDRQGKHSTHMAVPYRACGTASERSEFKHPDANLCLTQLAYMQRGLTLPQVHDCIIALFRTSRSQRESLFRQFVDRSRGDVTCEDQVEFASINSLAMVDPDNEVQLRVLHKFLSFNTAAINFWLESCIYPHETKLFPENLRRTAWNMAEAHTGKVVGFSGTNDNRSLLPLQVRAQDTDDTSIKGTNGRMAHLLLQPGKCSFARLSSPHEQDPHLAQRVLELAVRERAHALIDAGAQMAGMGQAEAATRLVDHMQQHGTAADGCQGVVFFVAASTGSPSNTTSLPEGWSVMDRQKHCMPKARSPIKEADAFVIFDEARCRGSDMKLKAEAKAVLTLGPNMGRDKFMQAAARLRQLAKGQSLVIAAPGDICTSIEEVCGLAAGADIQPQHVLQWVLWNTARANARAFPEYILQGKHFAHSVGKPIFADEEVSALDMLYGHTSHPQSMDHFMKKPMMKNGEPVEPTEDGARWLMKLYEHGSRRGHAFMADETGAAEECEREVEQEEEKEQEVEVESVLPRLQACGERVWACPRTAMQLSSASDVAGSQRIQVFSLKASSSRLWSDKADKVKAALLPQLNWATNVLVTGNFLSCSTRNTAMAAHVRMADNLLIFSDSSVLLVSEREAEHVLRTLRDVPPSEVSACLVNLAMCRWTAASPSRAWAHVPLAVGPLPAPDSALPELTRAVVAAQVFSGETEYACDVTAEGADGNEQRRAAAVAVVFGEAVLERQVKEEQAANAAEVLVALRGRRPCWPGSDLEGLCSDEVTRAAFALASHPLSVAA